MVDNKANLFIVGAMRAGTTSLMKLLSEHPEVYVSPIKEPHFFVDRLPIEIFEPQPFLNLKEYFNDVFPKPLHRAHIQQEEYYQKLFSLGEQQRYFAEGSISYMHEPEAGLAIQQYNPEAKIIILARDPLERAFSHFLMQEGLGKEKRSFENVVKEELVLLEQNKLPWYSILNMSFYDEAIERFTSLFPNNVLVISAAQLFVESQEGLCTLEKFLSISPFQKRKMAQLNVTRKLKFAKVFYGLKSIGVTKLMAKILPPPWKKKLFVLISKEKPTDIPLSSNIEKRLQVLFNEKSSCVRKS